MEALLGTRCWDFTADCTDYFRKEYGDVFHFYWGFKLSAPAETLIAHGLIDQETLDSLPRCGQGTRGGLHIKRRKTRALLAPFFASGEGAGCADRGWVEGEELLRKLESRILAIILPMSWTPRAESTRE